MTLNCSLLNFLIYEENFVFFFIRAVFTDSGKNTIQVYILKCYQDNFIAFNVYYCVSKIALSRKSLRL